MKNKNLQRFIQFICLLIIVWFLVYFFAGDYSAFYFTDRTFASYFPSILSFTASAAIYGLFVSWIQAKRKKWKNVLLFVFGLLIGSLPLLAYHGYFQYQCGFWNQEILAVKQTYLNKVDASESVKDFKTQCKINRETQVETLFVKQFTPYFEFRNPVDVSTLNSTFWVETE